MNILVALTVIALSDPVPIAVKAPDRATPVSYAREVESILAGKCVGCHNATVAQAKLNMEDVAGMLKGGKRGPSIVAGKPDAGPLFAMGAHRVEPTMPPKEKKDLASLTPEELGLIQRWIVEGAKDDSAAVDASAPSLALGPLPAGVVAVASLDMTADGRRLAMGRGNVVEVVDVDSGLAIATLRGHKDVVQSVRFRPDGRQIAVGGYREVLVWDCPIAVERATIHAHAPGSIVMAGGRGNNLLATARARTIRLCQMPTGKEIRTWRNLGADVSALTFDADGQRLGAGFSDGTIRVYKLDDGMEEGPRRSHEGPVTCLAYVGVGSRLASGSTDGTARLWPAAGEPTVWKHPKAVRAVAASADGTLVATGGDDGIARFYSTAGGEHRQIDAQSGPIRALAVAAQGFVAWAGQADPVVVSLDVSRGKVVSRTPGPAAALAFGRGGLWTARAGADGVKVWDEDGRGVVAFVHSLSVDATPIAVPGGLFLNASTVAKSKAGSGGLVPDASAVGKPTAISGVLFLDGSTLATAGVDGTVTIWAVEGQWSGPRRLGPHVGRVLSLDYSPDGKLLSAGGGEPSRSGEVKLWDVGKGALVRSLAEGLHSDNVCALRFSPDGSKLATGAADKFAKVVGVADGKELKSFEGHTGHVLAVDWKGDGKQLVTGSADGSLKVWDFESGDQVRTLTTLAKPITSARWIAGTTKVFGGSGDKTARLWDAENGSIERTFDGPADYVDCVATSRDGSKRAGGVADGTVFLWRADGGLLRKLSP